MNEMNEMKLPQIYVALSLPGIENADNDWFMCDQISIYSGNPDEKCLMIEHKGEAYSIYVKPSTFVYIRIRDNWQASWDRSAKDLLKDFPTAVWMKENK